MKYVLINRSNVVVDVLNNIRYIRLHPTTGFVLGCAESEGTGVIGSDDNTHYVLVKSDTSNSNDAVRVLEFEDAQVPETVVANKTIYNEENNEFKARYTLAEIQDMKQEENKAAFAKYLAAHPMTWTDGKEYGITQEDQSEISLNLTQYQIAVAAGVEAPTLEWHARHEECSDWTAEQLTSLSLAISQVVYPKYHQMQEYKTQIYNATTAEEVEAIECVFEEETSEATE